jgi:hypothetical protein
MELQLREVQPGDLIRAEIWNEILKAIADHEARIEKLEGQKPPETDAVVIDKISKRTIRVGEQLTVTGRNFGWTTGATVVYVGDNLITAFVSGSNTELVFTIPEIGDLPSTGAPFDLAISNATTTDTETINVLPRATPTEGDVSISYVGTDPPKPTERRKFKVEFEVTSHASDPVEVVLMPTLSTGWPLRLLAGSPLEPLRENRLPLKRLETKSVFVDFTIAGKEGTQFTVELGGIAGDVPVSSDARDFTVGKAAEQEDETITLSAPDGTEIGVPKGGNHALEVKCDFEEAGKYELTTEFDPDDGGWTVDTSDVPSPIVIEMLGSKTVEVTLGLTAPGAIPAEQPTTLIVRVRKDGSRTSRTLPVELTVTG